MFTKLTLKSGQKKPTNPSPSKRRVTAFGNITNGDLHISHESDFRAELSKLKGRVRIVVEGGSRTLAQNAYLWAMNTKLAKEMGWTPEEVHEYSKSQWNQVHRTRTNRKTGLIEDVSFGGTTHDKSIDTMAEYIDRYIQGWAELGYSLDSSDEYYSQESGGMTKV